MKRLKNRWFFGVVCEQIVFSVGDGIRNIKMAKPRPRFKDDAERARQEAEERKEVARVSKSDADIPAAEGGVNFLKFREEFEERMETEEAEEALKHE